MEIPFCNSNLDSLRYIQRRRHSSFQGSKSLSRSGHSDEKKRDRDQHETNQPALSSQFDRQDFVLRINTYKKTCLWNDGSKDTVEIGMKLEVGVVVALDPLMEEWTGRNRCHLRSQRTSTYRRAEGMNNNFMQFRV